jgi:hypothetical protein
VTDVTCVADGTAGTELEFADGEVTFGMMGGSVKLADVRRDSRIAIHCPTIGSGGPDIGA